jgi:hypothetical protein
MSRLHGFGSASGKKCVLSCGRVVLLLLGACALAHFRDESPPPLSAAGSTPTAESGKIGAAPYQVPTEPERDTFDACICPAPKPATTKDLCGLSPTQRYAIEYSNGSGTCVGLTARTTVLAHVSPCGDSPRLIECDHGSVAFYCDEYTARLSIGSQSAKGLVGALFYESANCMQSYLVTASIVPD